MYVFVYACVFIYIYIYTYIYIYIYIYTHTILETCRDRASRASDGRAERKMPTELYIVYTIIVCIVMYPGSTATVSDS